MSHSETYRNTLSYALAIVGGSEQLLAQRLGVKVTHVINWTMGIEPVPGDVFLRAVDVVLGATAEELRQSRELLNKIQSQSRKPEQ